MKVETKLEYDSRILNPEKYGWDYIYFKNRGYDDFGEYYEVCKINRKSYNITEYKVEISVLTDKQFFKEYGEDPVFQSLRKEWVNVSRH